MRVDHVGTVESPEAEFTGFVRDVQDRVRHALVAGFGILRVVSRYSSNKAHFEPKILRKVEPGQVVEMRLDALLNALLLASRVHHR